MVMKANAEPVKSIWIIRGQNPDGGMMYLGKESYDTEEEAVQAAEYIANDRAAPLKVHVFKSIGFAQKIIPATFTWVTE